MGSPVRIPFKSLKTEYLRPRAALYADVTGLVAICLTQVNDRLP